MKAKIHPTYHSNATITCACGNVITAGSTVKEQKTDICSACHPFYTGKQKLVDTAGRVDKFRARQKTAKSFKDDTTGGAKDEKKGKKDDKYMTIDQIKALKNRDKKKTEAKEAKKADTKKTKEDEVKTEAKKAEKKPAAKKSSKK